MRLNGELVAVPVWLIQVVKHYGMAMTDILDLKALNSFLSSDDIKSFYITQNILENSLFSKISINGVTSVQPYKETLKPLNLMTSFLSSVQECEECDVFKSMAHDIKDNAMVFLNEIERTRPGESNTIFFEMLSKNLSNANSGELNNYVIELFDITESIYGITLKPKETTSIDEATLLENSMRTLCKHYKYEDVCQTEIFKSWCGKYIAGI